MKMENFVGKTVEKLQTPALIVYNHVVKKNANRMIDLAAQYNISLRPHFKTSKCVEAAVMQTNGTKQCMAVSTLPEAEYLLKNGFDDILYAVPLSESKLDRCAELSQKMPSFSVMIDHVDIIDKLEIKKLPNSKKWLVFIKISCDNGRAGVPYNSKDAVTIAERLHKSSVITFQGLYAHCGDSYGGDNLDHVHRVSTKTTEGVIELVSTLRGKGINCPTYGIGSTPSCSHPSPAMRELTEWHPGNYIFYDVMQMRFGSCQQNDIACFVLSRIIGHYPGDNHMLIDCGFTALSLHGGGDCYGKTPGAGFGVIDGHPELKLSSMSQEVGLVKTREDSSDIDFSKYPIGSFLRVFPDHSCATCAMHRVYYVADESDVIIDQWYPVSGW